MNCGVDGRSEVGVAVGDKQSTTEGHMDEKLASSRKETKPGTIKSI